MLGTLSGFIDIIWKSFFRFMLKWKKKKKIGSTGGSNDYKKKMGMVKSIALIDSYLRL